MNLPRYKFSKESEPELVQFLKAAAEQKCKNKCDLIGYETWKKLLPPDESLLQSVCENERNNPIAIIDLCSDEEQVQPLENEDEEKESKGNDKSTVSDIACVIKENLETQDNLSNVAQEYLLKCCSVELDMLFELLEVTLSSEEVNSLGIALQNLTSSGLVPSFCHNLLIPKMKKEYCDKMENLLKQLIVKYSSIFAEESLSVLQKLIYEEGDTFLQYLRRVDSNYQSTLFRNFILSLKNLDDNNLKIVGALLNNDVEYEALSKLVEMLSGVAEDYSSDKNFGKLLMRVIDILGPNLVHLEQPLKHIIAGHKSVWKSKLEKTFVTSYEDSMLFTQSFRY